MLFYTIVSITLPDNNTQNRHLKPKCVTAIQPETLKTKQKNYE